MTALNGAVLGVPFLGSLLSPPWRRESGWQDVADVGALPVGEPERLSLELVERDAFRRSTAYHSVWAVRRATGEVAVFSPVCPHLGCHFSWNPGTRHFECPCHASVFSVEGEVLGGPAPRGLDPLPHRVEDGRLLVRWRRFRLGTPRREPA